MSYYVYAYLRSKTTITAKAGTPYYIGKGTAGRAWSKHKKTNLVPKNKNYIVILEQKLTEIGAFAIERRLIRWWGRKDLGTGILANLTHGGEGSSGRIVSEEMRGRLSTANKGKIPSAETRKKISIAGIGRERSPETIRRALDARIKNGNLLHSDETKRRMSERRKTTPLTTSQIEVLRQMSEINRGGTPWNKNIKTGSRSEIQNDHNKNSQIRRWQKEKGERDKIYFENPARCLCCGDPLPFRKRNYKFCGRICTGRSKQK